MIREVDSLVEFERKDRYGFDDLLAVMKILRGEDGCPWDKEQTHESIKKNFLEEVYEAIEAIDDHDDEELTEELGDVLLQVVFHAQIASQDGRFTAEDVTTGIVKKLLHRHPHIFGDISAETSEAVLTNWESIKREEKGIETHSESIARVPKSMPALLRAYKIQQRAKKAGLDWDDVSGAFDKLFEEIEELKEEIKNENSIACEEELGDILFSAVNIARFLEIGRAHV